MKFSTREDVVVPIDHVFTFISNFDEFERAALRRGINITQRPADEEVDAFRSWDIAFPFKGKQRQIVADLVRFDAPNEMQFASRAKGVNALGKIELVNLSRARTRLLVSLDMRPETLSGRLMIQSLKLTKTRLDRKFKQRIASFASLIESAHKI